MSMRLCVAAILAVMALGVTPSGPAREPAVIRVSEVSIEAGSAAVALSELIRQTGLQVLFEADVVLGHTTRAVRGKLGAAEVLRQMLDGSGLIFEFINERTVAVRAKPLAVEPSRA